tara:strand:+ start:551 stop:1078 length:528 start_codon:yes stop_codon:yes gene_type:complete
MARVTIEDCIKEIDNTFDICTLASKRAKDLASGASSSIDSKNKPSVLALKEIAQRKVGLDYFEVSNKQLADSKLFSGINEQEIVEELSQQINSERPDDSKITEETLTESKDFDSAEKDNSSMIVNKENDQLKMNESDSITSESEAVISESSSVSEESPQPEIPEKVPTDTPENKS